MQHAHVIFKLSWFRNENEITTSHSLVLTHTSHLSLTSQIHHLPLSHVMFVRPFISRARECVYLLSFCLWSREGFSFWCVCVREREGEGERERKRARLFHILHSILFSVCRVPMVLVSNAAAAATYDWSKAASNGTLSLFFSNQVVNSLAGNAAATFNRSLWTSSIWPMS